MVFVMVMADVRVLVVISNNLFIVYYVVVAENVDLQNSRSP